MRIYWSENYCCYTYVILKFLSFWGDDGVDFLFSQRLICDVMVLRPVNYVYIVISHTRIRKYTHHICVNTRSIRLHPYACIHTHTHTQTSHFWRRYVNVTNICVCELLNESLHFSSVSVADSKWHYPVRHHIRVSMTSIFFFKQKKIMLQILRRINNFGQILCIQFSILIDDEIRMIFSKIWIVFRCAENILVLFTFMMKLQWKISAGSIRFA